MLTIRKPLEIKVINNIRKISGEYGEKILADYGLMTVMVTSEGLLHLLMGQDIQGAGEGSNVFVSIWENYNKNTTDIHVKIIDMLLSRMAAIGAGIHSYRDTIYVTAVLKKLGVTEPSRFLNAIREIYQESKSTENLVEVYSRNIGGLKKYISQERKKENDVKSYFYKTIFKRLNTERVYENVLSQIMSPIDVKSQISAREFAVWEHKSMLKRLELRCYQGQVTGNDILQEILRETMYHEETFLKGSDTYSRYIANSLLNITAGIYTLRHRDIIENKSAWYRFSGGFQQVLKNTLNRQETLEKQMHRNNLKVFSERNLLLKQEEKLVRQIFLKKDTSLNKAERKTFVQNKKEENKSSINIIKEEVRHESSSVEENREEVWNSGVAGGYVINRKLSAMEALRALHKNIYMEEEKQEDVEYIDNTMEYKEIKKEIRDQTTDKILREESTQATGTVSVENSYTEKIEDRKGSTENGYDIELEKNIEFDNKMVEKLKRIINKEKKILFYQDREYDMEVREREPDMEVREREPDMEVREREPDMEVREREPDMEVREREPDMEVREREPGMEVREREPGMEVRDREPGMEVQYREYDMEVQDREYCREEYTYKKEKNVQNQMEMKEINSAKNNKEIVEKIVDSTVDNIKRSEDIVDIKTRNRQVIEKMSELERHYVTEAEAVQKNIRQSHSLEAHRSEINGSEINGSEINGSEINRSEINGSEINTSETNKRNINKVYNTYDAGNRTEMKMKIRTEIQNEISHIEDSHYEIGTAMLMRENPGIAQERKAEKILAAGGIQKKSQMIHRSFDRIPQEESIKNTGFREAKYTKNCKVTQNTQKVEIKGISGKEKNIDTSNISRIVENVVDRRIKNISEQVYDKIERRLQSERKRRGI